MYARSDLIDTLGLYRYLYYFYVKDIKSYCKLILDVQEYYTTVRLLDIKICTDICSLRFNTLYIRTYTSDFLE